MDKEYLRFHIKGRTALHIEPIDIHSELSSVSGDQALTLRTVERWSQSFREGQEEVEDELRSGRTISTITSANIEKVRNLIYDDSYSTIDELCVQTGLSHGTIERIIFDHLKLKITTAQYVPHRLTDSQRAEWVRICQENLAKFAQGT
ncbi:unnamed protein product [Rotaria sp. Silwood2]|nr:unnamed protein product [Rotaria sp. Silwood2]CAF4157837.1 unnamed protein product [Rotaria sp. Silwood2]